VELLEGLGYKVTVTQGITSGRTQISKGLLRRAREVLTEAVQELHRYASAGLPIVGLEPSALLTFRDEAPDLLQGDLKAKAAVVAGQAMLLEEFLVQQAEAGHISSEDFMPASGPLLVHGHCHQKALVGMKPLEQALALLPQASVEVIPSGCCGMAGSFGYEEEHYELSMQVGELVLFPAVREAAAGTLVVAPGTSCRHQIHDGAQAQALHPAQVLRDHLKR
jgi:Fe-S oxidoreductase